MTQKEQARIHVLNSPIQSQRDPVGVLCADEREHLPLWTLEAVVVLVIGEPVLVVWIFEEPLPCLRHHHLLSPEIALCHMAGGEISGVGQRHM